MRCFRFFMFFLLFLLRAGGAQAVVEITPSVEHLVLKGENLSILTDAEGQWSADEVRQRHDFVPTTKVLLAPGYSSATYWLRGELVNDSAQTLTRWLEVGSPRMEEIRYFAWRNEAFDRPPETAFGGVKFGMAARPVVAEASIFSMTLAPGERLTFYLQIRSRTAILMSAELWEPTAFRTTEVTDHQTSMLLLGSMLTISLYALLQGVARRDRILVLYGLWVLLLMAYEHTFQGYTFRYLWPASPEWALRATGTFGTASQCLLFVLSREFFSLRQFLRFWDWTYRIIIALLLIGVLANIFGDFAVVGRWVTLLSMIANAIWPLSMLAAWRRRVPHVLMISLASIFTWLATLARTLHLLGVVPANWLNTEAMIWAYYSGLVLTLVLGGLSRAMHLQREKEVMAGELMHARDLREAALEASVAQRTRELQEALGKADAANRAKNDFLARVSHDLRTPLTAIIGYADLVAAAHREDAERGRIIRRSARHLLELIDDLIDFARGRAADVALEPAPLYLYGLLEESAAAGTSLAKRRDNRFVLQAAADLPPVVELDAKRLRQVLNNLLGNAAKFTEGGEIRLRVTRLDEKNEAMASSVRLLFTVSDTGIGIAPEDQARVFTMFEQVKRRDKGLGMGLAIVRQWVERMGGTISLSSTLGQGTAISFVLDCPLAPESAVQRYRLSEKEVLGSGWLGQGLRILVVEDHQDIRELLVAGLENQGFVVDALADGASAIARLSAAEQPLPALVLTDQWLPGAHGNAVLGAVRRRSASLPVVLLSATPAAGEDSEVGHFDATLLKPVSMSQLLFTIGRLLGLLEQESVGALSPPVTTLTTPLAVAAPLLPDTACLAVLRPMIALGAVSDIADWADQLQAGNAAYGAFAEAVRQAAGRLDLPALQAMLPAE